ncbi:MAG: hypothetical protein QXG65_05790 [Thermoplasmata archaeon]
MDATGPSGEASSGPAFPSAGAGRLSLAPAAARLLLIGLAIREALSFWTGHPYDFEVWVRTAHAVAQGSNPYAFWPPVPGVSFGYLTQTLPSAAYLPFWPLLSGGLYRLWETVGGGNRFALYFLLKQPPILADLLDAYLLYRLAGQWTGRLRPAIEALGAWSLFPYAIVISAVWGQFDSIALATVLGALLARDAILRNVLYGWGIFVKWITFIFLPLELFAERGARRLAALVGVAIPVAATFAIFALLGWGVTNLLAASVSQTHGGGGGMSWVGILTSGPLYPALSAVPGLYPVLSYLWVPGIVLAGYAGARWVRRGEPRTLLRPVLFVTVAFLLLRWGLYEQYMVYLFALMILDIAVGHPGRRRLLRALTVAASAYLVVNNDFLLRFLTPIDPPLWPRLMALDATPVYGTFRTYALIALCALVTVLLVQALWVAWRDDPVPRPWIRWPHRRGDAEGVVR